MDDPTLLIHWLFSCLTLVIIGMRLIWRKAIWHKFNLGDWLSMAAMVCVVVRLVMIHFVLTWGTNNMTAALRKNHTFSAEEINRREIGSKLAISNRVFYNSYLWLQKLVLLDVYRRLYQNLRYERQITGTVLVVFFGTYCACQVTTFSECNPFHLYWQVLPDPGSCVKAQLQLVVVGVTNIVTDFILLILPLPIVFQLRSATWQRKTQLLVLFMMGTFIITITVIRLPINSINADSQVSRTTWASIELLVAAMVVNAPTIYGVWNKRRQDTKYAQSQQAVGGSTFGGTGPGKYGLGSGRNHQKLRDEENEVETFVMSSPGIAASNSSKDGITLTREVIVQRAAAEQTSYGIAR